MQSGALVALWLVCAGVIAWVWLRPLHDDALPPPAAHVARPLHRAAATVAASAPGAPEDEPAADDPAAAPLASGLPEKPTRQGLEGAMAKLHDKALQCRDVNEPIAGLLQVKLTITRAGAVQSLQVLPPHAETRTAECVKRVLRGLSFPRFAGTTSPTVEWTYPLLFEDHAAGR